MTPLGQAQTTSEGSLGLQAGRDLNVNIGPSVSEIRMLVDTFLQTNLPALREAAKIEAQKNIDKFLTEFVAQLGDSTRASAQEFAKPDAQNSFDEALRGCALKGEDADIELVSRILIERLSSASKPLLKLVCEEAIRVLPNLTRPQIAYLALIQYTKSVKHNGLITVSMLEDFHRRILPLVEPGFRLSPANRQYLASLGLLTINPVADANLLSQNLRTNYPFLPPTDEQIVAHGGQSIVKIIEEYGAVGAPTAFLTSTGQLIGMQHLVTGLGNVDMGIWIS